MEEINSVGINNIDYGKSIEVNNIKVKKERCYVVEEVENVDTSYLIARENRVLEIIQGVDQYFQEEFHQYLLDELMTPFKTFDDTGNNYVSLTDVKSAFSSFGLVIHNYDCEEILKSFTKSELQYVFDTIDSDDDGLINANDIIRELKLLGSYIIRHDSFSWVNYDRSRYMFFNFSQFLHFCNAIDKYADIQII